MQHDDSDACDADDDTYDPLWVPLMGFAVMAAVVLGSLPLSLLWLAR